MRLILTIFLLTIFSAGHCQYVIDWQKTLGGDDFDSATCTLQLQDGNYIVGGMSYSGISGDKTEGADGGMKDIWLLKINEEGSIIWQKTIGGDGEEWVSEILETEDGFILACSSDSGISGDKTEESQGGDDYWIIKIDSEGNIEWDKTIGGYFTDSLIGIEQTPDGGYLLAGHSLSGISGDKTEDSRGLQDYWLVKIDASGTIEWQKTIGGNGIDRLCAIYPATDSGFILGGESSSGITGEKTEACRGESDYWIIKTDAEGTIEWQKTIGGDWVDILTDIIKTNDGGYLAGGWSSSGISGDKTENGFGSSDYWAVKLSEDGTIEWQKTVGGDYSDYLFGLAEVENGYILGGDSSSDISGNKTENSEGTDYWVVKLDFNGNMVWQKVIGGSGADQVNSVTTDNNGKVVLAGFSNSGISGDKTEESRGSDDYWIVRLAPDTAGLPDTNTSVASLYPNPTTGEFTITLAVFPAKASIYDSTGKGIYESELNSTDSKLKIPGQAGVYFVQVTTGEQTKTFKVLKNN